MEPTDVVIGITNCGYIKTVVDTLKISRKRGIPTICITGITDSLVTKYSDTILLSSMGDYQDTVDQSPIIVSQMTIINTLQIGCAVKNADKLKPAMLDMLKLNELKRYSLHIDKVKIDRVKF
jgi:DNA-binding MurR/RpiR family transcriptional regulator